MQIKATLATILLLGTVSLAIPVDMGKQTSGAMLAERSAPIQRSIALPEVHMKRDEDEGNSGSEPANDHVSRQEGDCPECFAKRTEGDAGNFDSTTDLLPIAIEERSKPCPPDQFCQFPPNTGSRIGIGSASSVVVAGALVMALFF